MKRVSKILLIALTVCLIPLAIALAWFGTRDWDHLNISTLNNMSQSTQLLDKNNNELMLLYGAVNRSVLTIDQIPKTVQQAFVAVEDVRFYQHPGYDLKRIIGALWADLRSGTLREGASTITQQVARNNQLTAKKTWERKIQEVILAREIEAAYTKDEILAMYMNIIYLGKGAYGVQAAAETYFDKNVGELTLAEAALLAGIPKSPTYYNPVDYPKESVERRNLVLGLMMDQGIISAEDGKAAQNEPLKLADNKQKKAYPYGYFADEVLREAAALLDVNMEALYTGGYQIYTTLDPELQRYCEEQMAEDTAFPATEQTDGTLSLPEGAMVVLDNQGQVRALVGGRAHDARLSLNRVTQMRRQPGSTIKPLLVYAPAIEYRGYLPTSLLEDKATDFNGYTPTNAGGRYRGTVTLRTVVARSLNVPTVALLSELGLNNAIPFAERLGIPFDGQQRSLALALGGFTTGVTPMELASAYTALADNGQKHTATCIRQILDAEGQPLYTRNENPQKAMDPRTACLLNSMLTSVVEVGTGKVLAMPDIPLAAKTGTVQAEKGGVMIGNRDLWTVALNPEYVAVCWMGYDQTDEAHVMPSTTSGGGHPAAILRNVFSHLYPNGGPKFPLAQGIEAVQLDAQALENNQLALATQLTPLSEQVTELFPVGRAPLNSSDFWVIPQPPNDLTLSIINQTPTAQFTPLQSFTHYRLERMIDGNIVSVGQAGASDKVLRIVDAAPVEGVTAQYRVVPVHPELEVNGVPLEGPATNWAPCYVPPAPTPVPVILGPVTPEDLGATGATGAAGTELVQPAPTDKSIWSFWLP